MVWSHFTLCQEPLPKACLGCIIMVALIGMLKQVGEVCRLWRISLVDTVRSAHAHNNNCYYGFHFSVFTLLLAIETI